MTTPAAAEELNDLGRAHASAGRPVEAEVAYRAAIDAAPLWSVPWYNLGLLYKYRGRWQQSLDCNLKATELAADDGDGWWNLGIAATALGEWTVARRAWTACGIDMPPGEGPLELDFGQVPIRLDPEGAGEVVWATRIDPARAIIENIPLPTSAFRWHDLVLHDGAPEGYRESRGRKIPVFNVLARLQPSVYRTFVVEVATSDEAAIRALQRIADAGGGAAENWGRNTSALCRECSLGLPHTHEESPQHPANPHCGVAARDDAHLRAILDEWLGSSPAADLVRWHPAPEARS